MQSRASCFFCVAGNEVNKANMDDTRNDRPKFASRQIQSTARVGSSPCAAAHWLTSSRRIAAVIKPGKASGVQAKEGTPSAASFAASALSYAGRSSSLSASS
jgi:hypothetical protein